MHRRSRSLVAGGLAFALLSTSIPFAAFAQTKPELSAADKKRASELWDQGDVFKKDGKWAEALAKYEEVGQIVMKPGLRFNIAQCKENLGRWLEALDDYAKAEADAKAAEKNAKNQKTEKLAREAAEILKPRIPKLTFKLPSGVEPKEVTVHVDGKQIDVEAGELAVDPGKHKIEASAEKRVPFSTSVDVAEKQTADVVIKLPEQPKDEPEPPPPPPPPPPPSRKIPMTAWIAGGAGLVSLAGAGLFYGLRASKKSSLESACNADTLVCPAGQQDNIDAGKRYTTMGNVFLIVGVVGVGAGVVLWATAPKTASTSATSEPTPSPKGDEPSEKTSEKSEEKTSRGPSIRLVPYAPGADLGGLGLTASF